MLRQILMEVEKDSFRNALRHLLTKPNSASITNTFGHEKKTEVHADAFSYATRGTIKKTVTISVEKWQSDKGTRYIAFDNDYIVCAAFINEDNVLTGIITDDGYQNVGIGTNLLKFIKRDDPAVTVDTLRSKEGAALVKRVGETIGVK